MRIDTIQAGGTFQVRQDVPGRPLSTWLEGRSTPRPLGEALEISLAIVKAIEALHARGFVHCDIRPDNLLYDAADGDVYFADCAHMHEFGATIQKPSPRPLDNPYVAPGQALHEPRRVDARRTSFRSASSFISWSRASCRRTSRQSFATARTTSRRRCCRC